MEIRSKANSDDILLDVTQHPEGMRLILTDSYSAFKENRILYEAVVEEWSPSGTRVKLKTTSNEKSIWIDPTHFKPIVIEVLNAKSKQTEIALNKTGVFGKLYRVFDDYMRSCATVVVNDLLSAKRNTHDTATAHALGKLVINIVDHYKLE